MVKMGWIRPCPFLFVDEGSAGVGPVCIPRTVVAAPGRSDEIPTVPNLLGKAVCGNLRVDSTIEWSDRGGAGDRPE